MMAMMTPYIKDTQASSGSEGRPLRRSERQKNVQAPSGVKGFIDFLAFPFGLLIKSTLRPNVAWL